MITSNQNEKVKYYKRLMDHKKDRDKEQLFIVEGEHLVLEAIDAGLVVEVMYSDEKYKSLSGVHVAKDIMKKICDTKTPQGVIALCKQHYVESLSSFNRLLLLDNIQDPGNLGTIIRTSDAFNFDGIVMNTETVDVYNPKVIRATQGAIFRVPLMRKDLNEYIPFLKSKGVRVYGTALQGTNLSEIPHDDYMTFIMGNEGNGVSLELLEMTDNNIYIEMNGKSESLNVAIAASIIMYNFRK